MIGAIFLGGGTGKRLKNAAKPHLIIEGQTLLHYGVECLTYTVGNIPTVAVMPPDNRIPSNIHQTLEDPPLGGPIAGIVAGINCLINNNSSFDFHTKLKTDSSYIGIFSADAPLAPLLIPHLIAALPSYDGAVAMWKNQPNFLVGIYRFKALTQALPQNPRNCSAHSIFNSLNLATVADNNHLSADIDYSTDIPQVRDLIKKYHVT